MKDKSLTDSNQTNTISDGLQFFIDSMVEEIVIEGKTFDEQKKYLKKFCDNEELDYDKLVADITTFIEILGSFKTAFSDLQVKLAKEKGRECHISEPTLQKLVNHSLQNSKISNPHKKIIWPWLLGIGVCLIATGAIIFSIFHAKKSSQPPAFADRVESFVNETDSCCTSFWEITSTKFDSLQAEYERVYNELSNEDLDRVDDAIEHYREIIRKYGLAPKTEGDSKIVVDDIEYAYENPTTDQLHKWRDEYASTCSAKVRNLDCQDYTIPEEMSEEHPCLVYLVLRSRTFSEKTKSEVQEWFNLYTLMNDEQIDKLYDILYREAYKLGKIEKKNATETKTAQLNSDAYKYAKSGDFYKAYMLIDSAIALLPEEPNFYDSKGEFYIMQGRQNKALAAWNKVMELDPNFLDDYNGHTNLYDCLVKRGMITQK